MPNAPVRTRRLSLLALAAALAGGAALWSGLAVEPSARAGLTVQDESTEDLYQGKTLPSREYELAFADLGKVLAVSVKQGDAVTAGQELMRQDDRVEQARLTQLQIEADFAKRVELAEKQAELAKTRFEQLESLRRSSSGNTFEYDQARLELEAAEIRIGEEERQGLAAEASVAQLEAVLEQKSLLSPGDGIVQEVEAQAGEVFGPQQPAVKIVTIDPLDVETVQIPAREVARLRVGDPVLVRYASEDEWRDATVKFIDPVASGDTTDRRRVRLSLPNPDGENPAGLVVDVRLPKSGAS